MYINILETNATNFKLAGYISDSGKEVYIELLGISYGHLMLMDSIDSLKVLRNEEDPYKRLIQDIPGWHKVELRLDDITSGKPNAIVYGNELGTEEKKFMKDRVNQHIIGLYEYLQKNPWVRVSYTAPVWDGENIINVEIPNDFYYQSEFGANLSNYYEFGNEGLENYRFDDGSPLPWVESPIWLRRGDMYRLKDEHDGVDKTFVLQPTNPPKYLDIVGECEERLKRAFTKKSENPTDEKASRTFEMVSALIKKQLSDAGASKTVIEYIFAPYTELEME